MEGLSEGSLDAFVSLVKDTAQLSLDDLLSMPGETLDSYLGALEQVALAITQPVETFDKLSQSLKDGLEQFSSLPAVKQGEIVGALLTEIGAEALIEAAVVGGVTSAVATPASGAVVGTGVLTTRFVAKIVSFYIQMGRVLDRITGFGPRLKKLPEAEQVKVLDAVKAMSDRDLNYLSGLDNAGRIDIAAVAGQAQDMGLGGENIAGVVKGVAKGYGCSWASHRGGFWQRVWGVLFPVAYADGCGDFAQRFGDVLSAAKNNKWSDIFETGFKPKNLLEAKPLQDQFRSNKGIPGDWTAKPSKKGDGLIFHEPGNPHTDIRVMPGKPTSDYPNSRKPYIEVKKNGKYQDKNGNPLPNNQNEDAHIPLDEFKFPF